MADCIFCKIATKQLPTDLIYEDEHAVVFKDIRPKADTHLLIVSKLHIPSLAHTSADHGPLLSHLLLLLPKIAQQVGLKEGFRTILNTGKGGGQEIDHIHFHLLSGHLHSM